MLPNLIVPVLNRYDLLRRMFQSINYPIRDLLIIDNGGEFYDVLHSEFIDNVRVLNLPSNLGRCCDRGILVSNCFHMTIDGFLPQTTWFLPGALERLSEARRDEITLSDMFPFWHTFSVGEEVVRRVGLFDEALYPAYFEDNDYQRRAVQKNVHIRSVSIPTQHENSSTIGADRGLREKNAVSFQNNAIYYNNKMAKNDYGQGAWSLDRRRRNAWDTPR
jgi:hypothetical protein